MFLYKIFIVIVVASLARASFLGKAFDLIKHNTYCAVTECCENVYVYDKVPGK